LKPSGPRRTAWQQFTPRLYPAGTTVPQPGNPDSRTIDLPSLLGPELFTHRREGNIQEAPPRDTTPREPAALFLGSHAFKFLKPPCQMLIARHAPADWGSSINASHKLPLSYFFLGGTTASLKDFAKRNLTTVLAGILMGAPVWGFRPMRSLR